VGRNRQGEINPQSILNIDSDEDEDDDFEEED
jgi:hypothetical protein